MAEHSDAHSPAADIPTLVVDPFGEEFLSDPYRWHSGLRQAGPLFWLEKYGIYGSAQHEPVSRALQDHRTFCSGRGAGLADFAKEEPWRPPSLLLEVDPPLHDRTRGVMNKVVSLAALKQLQPIWRAKAEALAEELVARRRFDAVTDLAEIFPMLIFPDTVGLPLEGREHLLVYGAAVFNAFGPRNAIYAAGAAAAKEATRWVNDVCRRQNLAADGWGMQVFHAVDAGECSEDEAERLVRSLLSAGLDTTVNGIGNLLYALALYPDQWELLRSDPQRYRRKAVEEALRWDSTVQTFFRTTTCDAEFYGHTIPEGSKMLLFLAAANRDPRRWDRPDDFDIRRQASGHVAFGFGIHQCLGQMVARIEADLLLEAMIPRIRSLALGGPPERRLNNSLHALARLPVEIVPA